MELIRGTTPTIEMIVKNDDIDLHDITQVWIYISQSKKVKVDKLYDNVEFDYDHRIMRVKLSQADTLDLKAGEALIQVRVLLEDGTALATIASDVEIAEVYKEGEITEDTEGT